MKEGERMKPVVLMLSLWRGMTKADSSLSMALTCVGGGLGE